MSSKGDLLSLGATTSCCASVRPHGPVPPTATRTSGRRSRGSRHYCGATTRCLCGTMGSSSVCGSRRSAGLASRHGANRGQRMVGAEKAAFFVGAGGWAPTRVSPYLRRSSTWRSSPLSQTMMGLTRTARRLDTPAQWSFRMMIHSNESGWASYETKLTAISLHGIDAACCPNYVLGTSFREHCTCTRPSEVSHAG
jgi:hypothetical protein